MLWLFKRKKIRKMLEGTRKYLEEEFRPYQPKEPVQQDVRYSLSSDDAYFYAPDDVLAPEVEAEQDVQYSFKSVPQKQDENKDCYNEESVDALLRRFSGTSALVELIQLERTMDMSFVDKLLEHINRKQLRDSAVYKAAQIDRRLFSKIVCDRQYKPSKDTCIAFAFALQLTLEDAKDLLLRAGYSFSHSSKRDVVLEYFFREKIYNLVDINEILYRLGLKLIGR